MSLQKAIKEELSFPLPGIEFQLKMVPKGRFDQIMQEQKKISAAISVVLYKSKESGSIEMILIKRTEYDGPHSGQISFPGGKADKSDKSFLETAIRETSEEVGIELHPENYLGKLTPLQIVVTGFEVHPFVFFYPDIPDFKMDTQEVQYIIKVGISTLMDESLIKTTKYVIRGVDIDVPYYDISGEMVWGATSMILSEFVEILRRIKIKNPAMI